MKKYTLILLICCALIASLTCVSAQAVGEYTVTCTEAGPKLLTPTDTIGVTLDSATLAEQLNTLDTELEDVAIAEYELKLLRQKRDLTTRREALATIIQKASVACD